jgi:hypothetical protein
VQQWLSAKQKNNYLADREPKCKKENEEYYEVRHDGAIRDLLWHCIKTAV